MKKLGGWIMGGATKRDGEVERLDAELEKLRHTITRLNEQREAKRREHTEAELERERLAFHALGDEDATARKQLDAARARLTDAALRLQEFDMAITQAGAALKQLEL